MIRSLEFSTHILHLNYNNYLLLLSIIYHDSYNVCNCKVDPSFPFISISVYVFNLLNSTQFSISRMLESEFIYEQCLFIKKLSQSCHNSGRRKLVWQDESLIETC